MVTLNGIELNPSIEWVERFQSGEVSQSVRPTLGGRVVVQAGSLQAGQNITLVASEDSGWLTYAVVEQLRLYSLMPGLVLSLSYHGDLVNVPVVFRHNEAPAFDMQPLVRKSVYNADDYFIGSLKLMRI